jgi:hypothetical protein
MIIFIIRSKKIYTIQKMCIYSISLNYLIKSMNMQLMQDFI